MPSDAKPLKKRAFSLVEVLIALPLLALLSSILLNTYFQISVWSKKEQAIYKEHLQERYMRVRLSHILSHLVRDGKNKKPFYKEGIFYFKYDNGINKNPIASSTVSSTLFLREKSLYLEVFDKDKNLIRQEKLLDNIDEIEWQFGLLDKHTLTWQPVLD